MSAESLGLLLKAFRLPTMAEIYERVVQEAEQQGWGYRKFLQHLCEAEAQDRAERKLERLLKQSGQPGGSLVAGQSAARFAESAGRKLCEPGRERDRSGFAWPRQEPLSGSAGA